MTFGSVQSVGEFSGRLDALTTSISRAAAAGEISESLRKETNEAISEAMTAADGNSSKVVGWLEIAVGLLKGVATAVPIVSQLRNAIELWQQGSRWHLGR